MALRALIFDVDGTLAETEELHRRAFNEAFAAAGLPWSWDQPLYARLLDVTGGKERIRYYMESFGGRPTLDDAAVAALHGAKTERYGALVADGEVELRPGVARLLDEAREASVAVAIATTTSLPNVEALLRATLGDDGLSRFAVVGAGDVVPAKKPAPDIYTYVLERLGLPPATCVAVEDTVNGLFSARGAGLQTLVTASLYGGMVGFDRALALVDHLGDPGKPCRSLAGAPLASPIVTLDQISRWLDAAT